MRHIKRLNELTANIQHSLDKLSRNENLSSVEAEVFMTQVLNGKLSEEIISSWLRLSNQKVYSVEEIVAYAKVMRAKAQSISPKGDFMDTCGTGGDESSLINISTLVGLTLASLGVPIAKHGNRSISSKSGSADILEALGYPLNETPEETSQRIQEKKFGFMFAPYYHPTMKHVTPVRKNLGVKTIFNILGPLCNPAFAKIHLLGVYSREILDLMSLCLKELKVQNALVVSSEDKLDEISPVAQTEYRLLHNQSITSGWISPPENIKICSLDEVHILGKEDAYRKAKDTLQGTFTPGVEMLALNAVTGLFVWKLHTTEQTSACDLQKFINHNFDEIKKHVKSGNVWRFIVSWNFQ